MKVERKMHLVFKRMENSTCRISDLVRKAEFANRRQLERTFKKATGMTIGSWRKTH